MLDDGARDGIERGRFGERGGQPVQARGSRDQRAIARFAGPQRRLDLLPLDQLALGALALRVGLGAPAERRFVLPRAIERLRGARRQRLHVVAIATASKDRAAARNSSCTTATTRLPTSSGTAAIDRERAAR